MANNLRRLRLSSGLTQAQAAEELGTGLSQYQKLEYGTRRLSAPWIDRAARAFGVDPAEIVRNRDAISFRSPIVGALSPDGVVTWSAGEPPMGPLELAITTTSASIGSWTLDALLVFRHERRHMNVSIGPGVLGLARDHVVVGCIVGTTPPPRHIALLSGKVMLDQQIAWFSPVLRLTFL